MYCSISNMALGLSLALSALISTAEAANACSSAPYKDLLFLSSYGPAETYCQQKYPQAPVTTTVIAAGGNSERATVTTLATTAKSATTSAACTGTCSTWSSASKKGGSFVSTLCSCIEPPTTVTVTKSATTTTSAGVPQCTPNGSYNGNPGCSCVFDVTCDTSFVGSVAQTLMGVSISQCAYAAGERAVPGFQYTDSDQTCRLISAINSYIPNTPGNRIGTRRNLPSTCVNGWVDLNGINPKCGCHYERKCNTYQTGLEFAAATKPSFEECAIYCDNNAANCVAFNFNKVTTSAPNCVLLSKKDNEVRDESFTAGFAVKNEPVP